jgi:hypothetical protein
VPLRSSSKPPHIGAAEGSSGRGQTQPSGRVAS